MREDDVLARFLFSDSEYGRKPAIVKRRAFMPSGSHLSTSVFHVTDLKNDQILAIAKSSVERRRGKSTHGWATVVYRSIIGVGLYGDYNNSPARHVDLLGWPEEKDRQLSIAQALAAEAALVMRSK